MMMHALSLTLLALPTQLTPAAASHAFSSAASSSQSQDGWVELFDGSTLNGWTTKGGRYDGNAKWSVEAGTITGREGPNGAGGLIYTEKRYKNYEVELDAFITYPFDSGIFLRMTPRSENKLGAQVTLDYRPTGEVGGIYCDGWYHHKSEGKELYKRDEWNHFRVRCVGQPMHITVWMNDELLTDYRIPAAQAPRFAEDGLLGLQIHGSAGSPEGSRVRFKNIRLRELAADAGDYFRTATDGMLSLTDAGAKAGWKSLFNGTDLKGWTGAGSGVGYAVEEGLLKFLLKGDSPHLMTVKDYKDFHLRLDFKTAKMANSGLFLRASRDGKNPAYSGCEIQILDDFNWEKETNSTLKPYQFTGGLYGAVAPGKSSPLKPLGEWNTYEVIYRGSWISTVLNGKVLYDVDTHALDASPHFAKRAATGFIGLQRHAPGGQVDGDAFAWFRNLYIRELSQ